MDQEAYRDGYIAGWRSVRGPDAGPVLVPPCPTPIETAMYSVGFSCGVRDALATRTVGRRRDSRFGALRAISGRHNQARSPLDRFLQICDYPCYTTMMRNG